MVAVPHLETGLVAQLPRIPVLEASLHGMVDTCGNVLTACGINNIPGFGMVLGEDGHPLLQIEDGSLLPGLGEVLDLIFQEEVVEVTAITDGLHHDLLLGGIGIEFVHDTLVVFILFLPGIHEWMQYLQIYNNYIKIVNQSIDDDLIDSIIHTILISEYET